MQSYEQLYTKVQKSIELLGWPGAPAELYDPMRYLIEMGGKRIRPCLLLMGANLFTDELDCFMGQALAMEIFHNFTLMHDDIMDQAPLRRGQATVHEKWTLPIAILSGDAMLVESYKLLLKSPTKYLEPIFALFNQTATGVCEGQQMDMNFEDGRRVSLAEYLRMIELKTGVLLGCCIQTGSMLGGGEDADAMLGYNFGKNLGIAFQLQDDLLDVYGVPEKFGKQVGGDILANKKTFLLLKAMELAIGEVKKELDFWLAAGPGDSIKKIESVKAIYDHLGVAKLTESAIESYHLRAMASLAGINRPEGRKTVLSELSDTLLKRTH